MPRLMTFTLIIVLFCGFVFDAAHAGGVHKIMLHTSVQTQVMDEITQALFHRINVDYTIEKYPWKRVLCNMKNGIGDGVPFIYLKKERTEFLAFTDPVITTGLAVYFQAGKKAPAVLSSFLDLKGYSIGLVGGYRHCEAFENAIDAYALKVEYARNIELNFRKLAAGRFDCFIESELLIAPHLASGAVDKSRFKAVANAFCKEKFYFAFSKRSAAKSLIPRINQAIAEMKADGSMARIMGRE